MLPIIEREIVKHNWMTSSEFMDVVTISQMTPGPIAINAASFTGYKIGGVFGSALATFGVVIPPLIIVLIIIKFLKKVEKSVLKKGFFYVVKPITVALIVYAAKTIGEGTYFTNNSIEVKAVFISLFIFLILNKTKINAISSIILSFVLGVIFLS